MQLVIHATCYTTCILLGFNAPHADPVFPYEDPSHASATTITAIQYNIRYNKCAQILCSRMKILAMPLANVAAGDGDVLLAAVEGLAEGVAVCARACVCVCVCVCA